MTESVKFKIGDKVIVQTYDWSSYIIKELDNDMVFVTTSGGLGRDVHKDSIRDRLFGDILTEFPKHKSVIVVTNYPVGKICNVFEDSCYVKFNNSQGMDFSFDYLRKK
jgi:hypothetical protein